MDEVRGSDPLCFTKGPVAEWKNSAAGFLYSHDHSQGGEHDEWSIRRGTGQRLKDAGFYSVQAAVE